MFTYRDLARNRVKVARVAQLVEQRIENPRVAGSIPAPGTIYFQTPLKRGGRSLRGMRLLFCRWIQAAGLWFCIFQRPAGSADERCSQKVG